MTNVSRHSLAGGSMDHLFNEQECTMLV